MAKRANALPPKGTRDFLGTPLLQRRHVVAVVEDVYRRHGFVPLETPSFERLDTLLGKYGDEGDQLVFKILRRGQNLVDGIRAASDHLLVDGNITMGRSGETSLSAEPLLADMGLRYDLTVPLARVVAQHKNDLPTVYRRYQIQPVWRADKPGKGRFREFYQCDVDVVGTKSVLAEAEVAGAVSECLERLGFDAFTVRLNHRGLLRAMIEVAGVDLRAETEAIVALDKLDKIGKDGVQAELQKRGFSAEQSDKLLQLVHSGGDLEAMKANLGDHEAGLQAVSELEEVIAMAAPTAASRHLAFDPTLARGLGYYTGAIFEIAVDDLAGSLGGGGRYDGLVGMFSGQDVPAVGFSLGLERIIVVMEERGLFSELSSDIQVSLATTEKGAEKKVLQLAVKLRAAGYRVETVPGRAKPTKVRKSAHERNVPCALFLHESGEIETWRNEASDERESLAEADVIDWLGRHLS